MSDFFSGIGLVVRTGITAVALMGVPAVIAISAREVLYMFDLHHIAQGGTGILLVSISFVLGFALIFVSFVLWYRHRARLLTRLPWKPQDSNN